MLDLDISALANLTPTELQQLLALRPDIIPELQRAADSAAVVKARTDPNVFVPLVLKDEKTGLRVTQAGYHHEFQRELLSQQVIIWGHVRMGKALALGTPIPTPDGPKLLQDIRVGDLVYGGNHVAYPVTALTQVWTDKPCFEVEFDDGDIVVASGDHDWVVYDARAPKLHKLVRCTSELAEGMANGGMPWGVPLNSAASSHGEKKRITCITKVPPVPVRCLTVGSPDHTFLCSEYTVTHNCVTQNTRFQLRDGSLVGPEELAQRRRLGPVDVLDVDTSTHTPRWVPVARVFNNGVRDVCTITTAGGRQTTVTRNHPVWVRTANNVEAWVNAEDVRVDDRVLGVTVAPDPKRSPLSEEDAEFMGMLYGGTSRMKLRNLMSAWADSGVFLNMPHTPLNMGVSADLVVRAIKHADRLGLGYQAVVRPRPGADMGKTSVWVNAGRWLESKGATQVRQFKLTRAGVKARWLWPGIDSSVSPDLLKSSVKVVKAWVRGLMLARGANPAMAYTTPFYNVPTVAILMHRAGLTPVVRTTGEVKPRGPGMTELLADMASISPPLAQHGTVELKGTAQVGYEAVGWDRVMSVTDAGRAPTWGVEIDHPSHTHVTDGILTHNTQQLIGRCLWEIGHNPNIRIAYFCSTKSKAIDVSVTIQDYIKTDPDFRRVYPDVVPHDGDWATDAWSVDPRHYALKEPTFQALGYGAQVTGKRLDLVVFDDIIEFGNVITAYMRNQVDNYVTRAVLNRVEPDGGRVWWIGNSWHIDDAMHRRAKLEGWKSRRFPARDQVTKKPYWWTQAMLDEMSLRIGNPIEIARVIDCIPRSDESGGMKQEWVDDAIKAGLGVFGREATCDGWEDGPPSGWSVFVGVDLAVSMSARADKTAIVVFAVLPTGRRRLLKVLKGRWSGAEVLQTLWRVNAAYFPRRIYVESVAAQDHIRQFLATPAIMAAITGMDENIRLPILPFNTRGQGATHNKHHANFGVQGLFTEFAAGMWDVPAVEGEEGDIYVDPNFLELMASMLYYSSDDHTPDDLMAFWIANEGVRSTGGVRGNQAPRLAGPPMEPPMPPRVNRRDIGAVFWEGLENRYGTAFEHVAEEVEVDEAIIDAEFFVR